MLLLTQSTPLIFMGDEFGNSQQGNNNPYCQDNKITWLNWQDKEKNAELLNFWKQMIAFRKAHPILHPVEELRIWTACPVVIRICPTTDKMHGDLRQRVITGTWE